MSNLPAKRDEDGLLPKQREYLNELQRSNDQENVVARRLDISRQRLWKWMRDEKFLAAYNTEYAGVKEATRARFQAMQEVLPETAEDLLKSKKQITTQHVCSECGHRESVTFDVSNDAVRAKVWTELMKATGQTQDIRKLTVEGEMVHLTGWQKIALERVRRNLPISAEQWRVLEDLGVLPEGAKRQDDLNVEEGEYHEVKED